MMNHSPVNCWQEGLLEIFGWIDPYMWSVLWAVAYKADHNGHAYITRNEIVDSVTRSACRTVEQSNSAQSRCFRVGLMRIAQKRKVDYVRDHTGQVFPVETQPRALELYAGIKDGKIPVGCCELYGTSPYWYYQGKDTPSQTHKLIRKKFKKI